jgi:hypothetical protein
MGMSSRWGVSKVCKDRICLDSTKPMIILNKMWKPTKMENFNRIWFLRRRKAIGEGERQGQYRHQSKTNQIVSWYISWKIDLNCHSYSQVIFKYRHYFIEMKQTDLSKKISESWNTLSTSEKEVAIYIIYNDFRFISKCLS